MRIDYERGPKGTRVKFYDHREDHAKITCDTCHKPLTYGIIHAVTEKPYHRSDGSIGWTQYDMPEAWLCETCEPHWIPFQP